MSLRPVTRLLAAVVPALLLLPAAAHAEKVTVDDSVGDAKAPNLAAELLGGDPSDAPKFVDAPQETSIDIASTTVDHARKRLTVTVQLRDLVDIEEHVVELRIFTPDARYGLTVGRTGGKTIADLYPERITSTGVHDGPLHRPCRTVRARYDLATDTVTASAPTSCVGSPKWVQVAAVASRFVVTPQADGSVNLAVFADDAFRGGLSLTSRGRSPKVRRG